MVKVNLAFKNGEPQYECNTCGKCNSVFAKSLCKAKDRGCCWYFPKFTLYEIHKMVKSEEGLDVLERIISTEGTRIYNYYIHSIGYFDKEGYEEYLSKGEREESVKDQSMFFRECPFVLEGKGCSIPTEYRSFICNFFICNEVVEEVSKDNYFNKYIDERENYIKWIDWENNSLQFILEEKKLTLKDNYKEVIKFLEELPLEEYEFIKLKPIILE